MIAPEIQAPNKRKVMLKSCCILMLAFLLNACALRSEHQERTPPTGPTASEEIPATPASGIGSHEDYFDNSDANHTEDSVRTDDPDHSQLKATESGQEKHDQTNAETDTDTDTDTETDTKDSLTGKVQQAPPIGTKAVLLGSVKHQALTELSGLVASKSQAGVLFGVNDSGNKPVVYAMRETGDYLGSATIGTFNRDWETLASYSANKQPYLVIGDTGDNLRNLRYARLIFIQEPQIDRLTDQTIPVEFVLRFTFEDGPKNIEAMAIDEQQILFLSKEPIADGSPSGSRVYQLSIPDQPGDEILLARRLTNIAPMRTSFESRMAASLAGIDLNQPTAMDIDSSGRAAYVLTYRKVLAFNRANGESWEDAFNRAPAELHDHRLQQAEALAVIPGRAIVFSSEGRGAPIWAIPLTPSL